ncbi:MAG: hypothetical protein GY731_08175, partial [Gammaproteobacteria bacterium]|nr:hypothetical protein [Gammaproteobacteria bacterium]
MAPWLGIMLISLLLATVIAGLRIYQQHYNPHPEWVRKILHILMGLVALSFPWIFSTTWPVWTLAAIATGGLLLLKLQSLPGADWGGVVHGVKRLSLGEFYFPIAIAGIFQLAQGNIILYSIPILVLTLADATAALIGVYYGKSKYHATDGDKSVEGSAAFFTIAFLSVHIPLLLFTDIGRADCLLIGFIMGVLVMLFEALAWRGLDNLFIPFGSFFLLDIYWDMPTADLLRRFGIVVAILLSLPLFRRLTTFNDSAAIGVALVGYVSWALGGLSWLLPPSIVFVAYTVLNPSAGQEKRDSHDLRAVFTVSSAGLFWLFIHRIWHQELFLFFFTLAFAANLAMLGIVR